MASSKRRARQPREAGSPAAVDATDCRSQRIATVVVKGVKQHSPKIIRSIADIRAGVRHLRGACPAMRAVHDRTGDPPLRRFAPGFAGLARIVTGQQLSIASAAAIWGRLEAALRPFTAERLLDADTAELAALGLSRAKIRTLRALAEAVAAHDLDLAALARADDGSVREALTAVHGIGPWTADIYILFCLGRADAWAAGDLALQVGTARVLGADERFTASELEQVAERWRPWRGVAARLIWADYALPRPAEPATGPPPGGERRSRPRLSRIRETP